MRALPLTLLLFAACKEDDVDFEDIPEFPAYLCGIEAIETNPNFQSSPGYDHEFAQAPDNQNCWVVEYDEDPITKTGPVRVTKALAPTPRGDRSTCEFTGTANQVRAEITEGGCLFTGDAGGYARFWITDPMEFQPRTDQVALAQFRMAGEYAEVRDGNVLAGRQALGVYNYHRLKYLANLGYPYPDRAEGAEFTDPFASCATPRCFRADFAGKGTLVDGTNPPCENVLSQFATPFSITVDERGYVAFASVPPPRDSTDWLVGAAAVDRCATRAFSRSKPAPITFYDIDWSGTPTMTMDVTTVETSGVVTGTCHSRWTTTLTACL
jgi:hypothetical protein